TNGTRTGMPSASWYIGRRRSERLPGCSSSRRIGRASSASPRLNAPLFLVPVMSPTRLTQAPARASPLPLPLPLPAFAEAVLPTSDSREPGQARARTPRSVLADLRQQRLVVVERAEQLAAEAAVALDQLLRQVVDRAVGADRLHEALDQVVEPQAEPVEVLAVHHQQPLGLGVPLLVADLLGEVRPEDAPRVGPRLELGRHRERRAAGVHRHRAEALPLPGDHHAHVEDVDPLLLVG